MSPNTKNTSSETAATKMPKHVTIAIDAMGGDHGVKTTVPGAAKTLEAHPDLRFLFFGEQASIKAALAEHEDLKSKSEIIHTDKHIKSDDKPSAALRASKDTSMRMAIEAVHNGKAHAVVSAGNTGALMALAKMILKPLPGIHRPAIASVFPAENGETIMLDLGANVLVDAENLTQFAVLGAAFARIKMKKALPIVGLLNVGSEDTKGPDHVRAAAQTLSQVDFSGHYYGFVEGDDITKDKVDVIVADGYAGNIALKTAEGVGAFTGKLFKEALSGDPLSMLGAALAFMGFRRFKNKVDPRRYNGGVFLGLNGLCVKSHGGGDALAFSSALGLAVDMAESGYVAAVADDIKHLMNQESFLS